MKREELEALGLNKEQIDKVLGIHHREHDPVKKELEAAQGELRAEKEKASAQEAAIKDLKKNLAEFKDADVGGMRQKIETLEADIRAKEESHQKEIADRDFNDLLKEGIAEAKGKNARAITALLDMDALKSSKNQKEDVAAALKTLMEAEDSKMLFGEPEPNPVGTGNFIGQVQKTGSNTEDAALRAAMGLPPVQEQK